MFHIFIGLYVRMAIYFGLALSIFGETIFQQFLFFLFKLSLSVILQSGQAVEPRTY